MADIKEPLIPKIGVVTDIRIDTPDVKTFRVVTPDGKKAFDHMPGQCAMLSIPGVGEAMFSITSSPTNTEFMEFSIKKCGCVTEWLHSMEVGQEITIRGPYGRPFPVDTDFAGHDLLFVAGGIGLAPLRSVINYCRHYRDRYGKIDIVYGSRSKQDLVDYKEIIEEWANDTGVNVHLTIDREQPEWDGHVGFVPNYVKELGFTTVAARYTPLPMLIIGYHLSKTNVLKAFKDVKCIIAVLLRLIAYPLVSLGVLYILGVRGTLLVSVIISLSAPVAAVTTMFSSKFGGGDTALSVDMVSLSTVLSIITMPAVITLAQLLA